MPAAAVRLAAVATLLAACVHPELGGGTRVLPLGGPPPPACQALGTTRGRAWGSAFYGDGLADAATDDARNQAAGLGATHYARTEVRPSAHACRVRLAAFRCGAAAGPQRGVLPPPATAPAPPSSAPQIDGPRPLAPPPKPPATPPPRVPAVPPPSPGRRPSPPPATPPPPAASDVSRAPPH